MFTNAGPGRIIIRLRGQLNIKYDDQCCKHWYFAGNIHAESEKFNFDPRDWGERVIPKELMTRIIHYTPGGRDFMMYFPGSRRIEASGDCPCP